MTWSNGRSANRKPARPAVALALLCICIAATAQTMRITTPENNMISSTDSTQANWINDSNAQWVWPSSFGDGPNQYVNIIQDFELPSGGDPATEFAISADTNYAAYLNGQFIDFGQWGNHPNDKTFDVLPLASARAGANRLCILAWYDGENSSQYSKGAPGVVYAVRAGGKIVAASGTTTRVRRAPDYVSGKVPRVTGQLSFTFEHHGGKLDDWLQDDYELDASWLSPAASDLKPLSSRPVRPRPVAKLILQDRSPMRVHSQGVFSNTTTPGTLAALPPIPAVGVQRAALSWRPPGELFVHPNDTLPSKDGLRLKPEFLADTSATGAYVVLDVGREEAGLLELEIDAPAGTVLDIGYGEHLEDMRVRAHVGGRNFAVRHVCGAGRQIFMHPFLRLAGRYLQVHIIPAPDAKGPITLYYAGLRPTPYPVPQAGSFRCTDSLHNEIWRVSLRTLELCMHEHYEDCPWREQSLYAMDMRNQVLAGYYCFGNYDFVRASLDLLGKGMNEKDGWLELCAPAQIAITIPSFSLAWILTLDDYLLYSGDREFVRSQLPIVRRILATAERDSSGPIVLTPRGKRMWNFYEWAPGLDGSGVRGFEDVKVERYEAPLNLFYLLALDATARMSKECGERPDEFAAKSKALKVALAPIFWDENERAFQTRVGGDSKPHFAELTQALAILAGAVPEDKLDALRERLASDKNGLVPCTLSHCLYKFDALMTDRERFGKRVFDAILRDWGYMLRQSATSFWETIDGASAFGDAGSLCHGWSGIPAYFYGRYILGVEPTEPGFAKYQSKPLSGIVCGAEGKVPRPNGQVIEVGR